MRTSHNLGRRKGARETIDLNQLRFYYASVNGHTLLGLTPKTSAPETLTVPFKNNSLSLSPQKQKNSTFYLLATRFRNHVIRILVRKIDVILK